MLVYAKRNCYKNQNGSKKVKVLTKGVGYELVVNIHRGVIQNIEHRSEYFIVNNIGDYVWVKKSLFFSKSGNRNSKLENLGI